MSLSKDELLQAYRVMTTIRAFEERVHVEFAAGEIPGFVHLYAGEEACATGICLHLSDDDFIASTHRGHGHCIAKGVGVPEMMAELFGRATGICKGKGGSMHIADLDKGMLGANGIVGAGIPLATGAGLSAQLRGSTEVAVAFFGDGATNQGAFHESLNMAANWKLPVLYVVENNGFGEFTPTEFVIPVKDIAVRADSYAMKSLIADGMDFFDVFEKTGEALEHCRSGQGPVLLECKTYRFGGHFVGDPLVYRSKEEAEDWIQNRDPLDVFEQQCIEASLVDASDLRQIDLEVKEELDAAVEAAEAAPMPDPSELTADVYFEGEAQ